MSVAPTRTATSTILSEVQAREFLGASVPLVPTTLVRDEAELDAAVAALGGNVVLKGAAPWLVHKSDLGMVRMSANGDASTIFRELMAYRGDNGRIDGVLVQPRLTGHEMLVGIRRDPALGVFLVIGMGGVDAEVDDDVVVLSSGASAARIRAGIYRLRGSPVLRGFRGKRPADLSALISIARSVDRLSRRHPEISELDLNPVIVGPDAAVVVDARITLSADPAPERRGHHDLESLFRPRSIVVVGASASPTKLGARALRYLVDGRFPGSIHVVHPTEPDLLGIPAVRSVTEIQPPPDLVSIVVGSSLVPSVLDDCVAAGASSVVIHSGEFGRTRANARSGAASVERAKAAGVVILGPNSMGVMSPPESVFASFAGVLESTPLPTGSIALVSQSGAIGSTLLSRAADDDFGFSRWVSTGNEIDADVADVLAFLAQDDRTTIVIGYLESIRRGSAFRQAARSLRRAGKPLLVYQGGRSIVGRDVMSSHTGRLAPMPRLVAAFLDAVGAIRAPTLASMLTAGMIIEREGRPCGPRTAIVTMSGAAAGVCADVADRVGLTMARFSRETTTRLQRLIPASGRVRNPVDVTAHAMTDPSILIDVIDTLLADPGVDQLVVQLTTNADPIAEVMAEAIVARVDRPDDASKTLIVSRLGSPRLAPLAMDVFRRGRIPVVTWPEQAIEAAFVTGEVGRQARPSGRKDGPRWTSS